MPEISGSNSANFYKVVTLGPVLANSGPDMRECCKICRSLAKFLRALANLGPSLAHSGQHWATLGQTLVRVGQGWPIPVERVRNMLPNFTRSKLVEDAPHTAPNLAESMPAGRRKVLALRMFEGSSRAARGSKDGVLSKEVQREHALLSELDHPFILQLVKTFETAGSAYMLTELVTGGELPGGG